MAAADDSRYYNEHDDRVGGPQFRNRKVRGPFRARMHSDHQGPRQRHRGGAGGFGPNPRSRFDDDDGDINMGEGSQDSSLQRRYNPYGRPGRRGDGRLDRDRKGGGGSGHRGGGPSGVGGGGGGGGAGGKKGWFKIIIPYGKKYEKKWLLDVLQNLCPVPFTPVKFSTEGHRVQFYIEDSSTANALQKISRKITDAEGYKVIVISNPCAPSLT
ncbi:hypothetical protein AALO_G00193410 [Alosa alosa]|uniref:Nuclear RNA export factor Tap RNA-binding domain-containing protein n=1 Tax=Alosa alosa TaxID=278164 RepID=A0AAV6GCM9_9TELE|nr:hypothetical protein AALO_G00193410 [Alosa alosa]